MKLLEIYFDQIKGDRYKPLSAEEERELLKDWPSQACKDRLVEHNLRFAVDMAKKLNIGRLPLADLIGYANQGLCVAVERFDPSAGFKFISYAVWWIRQSVFQAMASDSTMRTPLNVVEDIREIGKVVDEVYQKHQRPPTTDEILEMTDLTPKRLEKATLAGVPILSMDFDSPDEKSMHETVGSVGPLQDEMVAQRDVCDRVHEMLERLTEREVEVLKRYYGFYDEEETLEEIGLSYGLTRERVRQIKEAALRKLRHPSNATLKGISAA